MKIMSSVFQVRKNCHEKRMSSLKILTGFTFEIKNSLTLIKCQIKMRLCDAALNSNLLFFLQIIFHGTDRKSLHQHISPKCLPDCYGGTLQIPRVSGAQWLELLLMCDKEYDGK